MRHRALVATLLCAMATPAFAQLSVGVRLGGARDALAYGDGEPEGRMAAAGDVDVEYSLAEGRGRFFYSLDAATYSTPGRWETLRHELGGVHRGDLDDSGRLRLFLGAGATWEDNGEAWSVAGYRGLGGFANVEYHRTETSTLRAGYRLDGRRFPDIPELDQLEHAAFVSALFSFQTRTTLIGEVRLGAKGYAGGAVPFHADPVLPEGRSGRGRGGMGPGVRPGVVTLPGGTDRATLIGWHLRLAQSLADRTGLSVDYSARRTSGEVPPALITTPAHFYDDGVYDDPYASDAWMAGANLKHVFVGSGVVRGWLTWQRKDYRATAALDLYGEPLPGGELRRDRVWRAGASWRVPLLPERTGRVHVDLELGYAFTDHRSNDAFYDYASHAVGATLGLAY